MFASKETYRACIYTRLSRDDGDKPESDSIANQRALIRDYLKQHKIHLNGCCINAIKEIQQWRWKQDKISGRYLDEPVDVFDDAMACLRYCIEPYRKPEKRVKVSSARRLGL